MRTLLTSAEASTVLTLDAILAIWGARCARRVREVVERSRLGNTGFTTRATTFMPLSGSPVFDPASPSLWEETDRCNYTHYY